MAEAQMNLCLSVGLSESSTRKRLMESHGHVTAGLTDEWTWTFLRGSLGFPPLAS